MHFSDGLTVPLSHASVVHLHVSHFFEITHHVGVVLLLLNIILLFGQLVPLIIFLAIFIQWHQVRGIRNTFRFLIGEVVSWGVVFLVSLLFFQQSLLLENVVGVGDHVSLPLVEEGVHLVGWCEVSLVDLLSGRRIESVNGCLFLCHATKHDLLIEVRLVPLLFVVLIALHLLDQGLGVVAGVLLDLNVQVVALVLWHPG